MDTWLAKTNMTKIKLNISERLFAIKLINEYKGDLETLSHLLEDTKKFSIDEKEWKKANRTIEVLKNEKGEDVSQWKWDNESAGEKEIELNTKTLSYLLEAIEKKSTAKELTLADVSAIALKNKLTK
jgi:hypothetical protein